MTVTSITWLRGAQRVLADITGMTVIHGVTPPTTGAGVHSSLRPVSDLLIDAPAVVMGYGGGPVISGPRVRHAATLNCAIWRPREELADAYDGLMGDLGNILEAIAARGKAYGLSTDVQSLLLTSFSAVDGAEWPPNSNRWYLVLPFECEMVVDVDAPLTPA